MHLYISIIDTNLNALLLNWIQLLCLVKQKIKLKIKMASGFPKLPGFVPTQDIEVLIIDHSLEKPFP
jgi:hypothetical protein